MVRKVLAVALQQLAEVGYQRLSIPDVASRAGVNKTSVYRRWASKKALIFDALSLSMPPAHEVPDSGHLNSDLLALARQTADFIQSGQGKGLLRMMFAEKPLPAIRKLVAALAKQQGLDALRKVVQRAADCGELRADVDADLILFALAGALMHRAFIEQRPIDEAQIEKLIDLLLHGACARRPQAKRVLKEASP